MNKCEMEWMTRFRPRTFSLLAAKKRDVFNQMSQALLIFILIHATGMHLQMRFKPIRRCLVWVYYIAVNTPKYWAQVNFHEILIPCNYHHVHQSPCIHHICLGIRIDSRCAYFMPFSNWPLTKFAFSGISEMTEEAPSWELTCKTNHPYLT